MGDKPELSNREANEHLLKRLAELEGELAALQKEYDEEVISHDIEEKGLKEKVAQYKAEAPLCETHQPSGGTRSGCLICGLIHFNAAISKIDYLLGEPNEMECSPYDVHCNEEAVVEGVERMVMAYRALQAHMEAEKRCDFMEHTVEIERLKAMIRLLGGSPD